MMRPLVICEGADTCIKDCGCKEPHLPYTKEGQHISDCEYNSGSCYHSDHKDGEFRECGHLIAPPIKLGGK